MPNICSRNVELKQALPGEHPSIFAKTWQGTWPKLNPLHWESDENGNIDALLSAREMLTSTKCKISLQLV